MNSLIKFFITNHKLTIILSIMMVVFGVMGVITLNAESYPSVNFASATIETRYEGATAEDVETKITKPIEDKIREVSGLKDVRSVSKSGFSSIFVRVDMNNEDEDQVLDDLQKAVDSVSDLPEDLRDEPKYLELNSEEFPAIEVAIIGKNDNRQRDIVADHLKEELEDNRLVKNVREVGFSKRQFNIRLDAEKMLQYHIGLEEVLAKIRMRNVDVPGGKLEKEGSKQIIRVEGKVQNTEELEKLVLRSNFSGQMIRLEDIAEVIDGKNDVEVLASFDGKPATFLVVNKKAGADTIKLVEGVDSILERFKRQYKDQFEVVVYNNEAQKVKKKLDILSSNAISGLLFVVIFMFIFLPGKIGVAASLSLPLAVMATLGYMPYFGMNLDAITILALVIALGMLVDNSVVISENFARLRSEEGMEPAQAAFQSVKQLWLPITGTALTTIAAFLPMLVTTGIMGQFIKYIPIVVTISLLVSLGEGFFLLPLRLIIAGKRMAKVSADDAKDWFHKFIVKFENFMRTCIKHRYIVAAGFMTIVIGSLMLMILGNKFILFPSNQVEMYLGRVEMPRGTILEATEKEMESLVVKLQSELGDWQRGVTARSGISKAMAFDAKGATGDNHGLIIVYASDKAKYNIDYKDFLAKMRKVESETAMSITFEAQVNGPPVGEAINATFRSNDSKTLQQIMDEVVAKMEVIPGVRDIKVDDILGEEEIKVKIDYAVADRLGISVDAIGAAIRTALSGTMVSQVTLDNKEVDLNVRYSDNYRFVLKNIEDVRVMDNRGNLVPVRNVAKVNLTDGAHEIKRFDFKRAKTLTGDVDENQITSVEANSKLRDIFHDLSTKYSGVTLVFGGQEESTKESLQSLFQALILSLLAIFGLLVFLFNSYIRPLIIMTTIPLGLLGFSIAFFLHNEPISFMSMIGMIGLGGIIVNSGIVLISFIDQMRADTEMTLEEILAKASGMRLRAVLVTSLTTISGLLPTAYGWGGSDAMLIPMTLAMAWGLTSGTILTLIWAPCAYAISEDIHSLIFKENTEKEMLAKYEFN